MSFLLFKKLWDAHPQRAPVCDEKVFPNQCAMRMGVAFHKCGINLGNKHIKTCRHYNYRKFKDHKPIHILRAQEFANLLVSDKKILGSKITVQKCKGSVFNNRDVFEHNHGLLFIKDGWNCTDHIDLWDGYKCQMVGSYDTVDYMKRGKEVWFWKMHSGIIPIIEF